MADEGWGRAEQAAAALVLAHTPPAPRALAPSRAPPHACGYTTVGAWPSANATCCPGRCIVCLHTPPMSWKKTNHAAPPYYAPNPAYPTIAAPATAAPAYAPLPPHAATHAPSVPPPMYYDPEALAAADYHAAFADAGVRAGFVRRVLGIVFVQLALTAAVTVAFFYVPSMRLFVARNPAAVWGAWACGTAVAAALACSPSLRRSHPANLVALGAFTLAFAYMVGATTAFYGAQAAVTALAVTACVVGFTLGLAAHSGLDFTRHGQWMKGWLGVEWVGVQGW